MNVKIFLQRDKSEEASRYRAYDDRGELIYLIRGRITPSGESMTIRSTDGGVMCRIRRLGLRALSAYSISAGGESARLNIAVGAGRAAVRFRGISFHIRGDVLTGSYDILDADNSIVCVVYKDYAKSCIELSVNIKERELFCMAAAACIDSLTVTPAPALQMT